MPKNSRNNKNNRGRSVSPKTVQQPNKKQNTTQTIEPATSSVVQTVNTTPVNDMEVDNTPVVTPLVNNKGKEKEVTLTNNTTASNTMNIDDSSDPTENNVATEDDILAFTDRRPLEKFFAYCLLEKYKGGNPQQKSPTSLINTAWSCFPFQELHVANLLSTQIKLSSNLPF